MEKTTNKTELYQVIIDRFVERGVELLDIAKITYDLKIK